MNQSHQQPPDTPLRFFWHVLWPHKRWAVPAMASVVVASALGQGTSYFFKLIVDAVEAGDLNNALW